MSNLNIREEKIQEKRKTTPFHDFLKEICSWGSLVYTKDWGIISRFPRSNRVKSVIPSIEFANIDVMNLEASLDNDFFLNLCKLYKTIPLSNMRNVNAVNSEYADVVVNSNNVYLSSTVVSGCENILYSVSVKDNSKNVINGMMIRNNCNNIFSSKTIINSFNIFYSNGIHHSSDIWFSANMVGCNECLICNGLNHQSYCIENVQYSKEEYYINKEIILRDKNKFAHLYDYLRKTLIHNVLCDNTIGKSNIECNNIENGYYCYNVNNGRNIILHGSTNGSLNAFDCYTGGSPHASNFYGVYGSGRCDNLYCCVAHDGGGHKMFYCIDCGECSYCIGCVGLKNKSFCILNKQYSKEERFEKANEIFAQMEKDGTLGAFFPGWMNPFYFNDTAAYLIDDTFTKEEVEKDGYMRRDEQIKIDISANAEVITISDLNTYQGMDEKGDRKINPEILKKVIKDEKGNYYRIVPMELEFLQKHGLPLPEIHWLERIKLGFKFK